MVSYNYYWNYITFLHSTRVTWNSKKLRRKTRNSWFFLDTKLSQILVFSSTVEYLQLPSSIIHHLQQVSAVITTMSAQPSPSLSSPLPQLLTPPTIGCWVLFGSMTLPIPVWGVMGDTPRDCLINHLYFSNEIWSTLSWSSCNLVPYLSPLLRFHCMPEYH